MTTTLPLKKKKVKWGRSKFYNRLISYERFGRSERCIVDYLFDPDIFFVYKINMKNYYAFLKICQISPYSPTNKFDRRYLGKKKNVDGLVNVLTDLDTSVPSQPTHFSQMETGTNQLFHNNEEKVNIE